MNRRGFLKGLLVAAVAPAIIRTPGLLMPIKPSLLVDTSAGVGHITFASAPRIGDTITLNGTEFKFDSVGNRFQAYTEWFRKEAEAASIREPVAFRWSKPTFNIIRGAA